MGKHINDKLATKLLAPGSYFSRGIYEQLRRGNGYV